ncbi:hypothetical protein CC2G_012645 [Coprinopsis cinerea AmutBmut pab1-1]|nr:hypothetical protein CC2G_012645 [Coprinopsis cinerea AmutBmut pab1-1]
MLLETVVAINALFLGSISENRRHTEDGLVHIVNGKKRKLHVALSIKVTEKRLSECLIQE